MSAKIRLALSAAIAFCFYAGWAYWANLSDTIDLDVTIRTALVQGTYSGFITLVFTYVLENIASRFHNRVISLTLITPFICSLHKQTKRNKIIFHSINSLLLTLAKTTSKPRRLIWIAPLLPLTLQTTFVIGINWLNQTPNLWLTVAPSIGFSALYGYVYLFTFLTQQPKTVT